VWFAAWAAILLLAALPAWGQVNNAIVEVVVAAEDGSALPGATVTVVDVRTGSTRGAVSNADGLARFPALTPGKFDVTTDLVGFNPVVTEGVEVFVGQVARIRVTLKPTLSESVQVTAAAPVVDIYKTDSSTNIVPEQIEQLPTQDRDFQRLAFIAPAVQRERGGFRFITGGPVIGSAGNASQATILVDGVDYTDQALGLSRTRFSQDAIQEFRVINNRFDAEIGGSAGGALSVVTRSGGNETRGSVFTFFRADELRKTGALESGNQDFSRWQGGFTLGGAIKKDRTHYFVSFEQIDEDNIVPFRPGGVFASQARDIDIPITQSLGLFSLDHAINDDQSIKAKVVFERYRQDNFRVGGVNDPSFGQELNRDNWNANLEHSWVLGGDKINQLRVQFGNRSYDEPTNSNDPSRLYTLGTTLVTGTNTVGNLLGEGDYYGISDTFYWTAGKHNLKAGVSFQRIEERSDIPVFENGYFVYLGDPTDANDPVATAPPPFVYIFGTGSADVTVETDLISGFIQDDWQISPTFKLSMGLRYDLDTDGNNPDFTHPLVPEKRDVDDDNIQPRLGFSWDLSEGEGRRVLRGGAGQFTGRYLLVPAFTELQQNGESGWLVQQRLNGLFLGLPAAFWLDPDNPQTTGVPLQPDLALIDQQLDAPEAFQSSLGYSVRLGDTGLFFDLEGLYVEGDDEIVVRDVNYGGNANPVRPNPAYNQINTYTNEGRSEYKALIASLNGQFRGGHLFTASLTYADKKNISDDFSPAFPSGYPSDPANIEGEWGRSRGDERLRFVASAVFKLPWNLTLAPIFEYGSGQPWNPIVGLDVNNDGKNSDRLPGVGRNSKDGPSFRQLSVRLTKAIAVRDDQTLEIIVEAFNVLDHTNYDVSSVNNAQFLSYPTVLSPTAPVIANPNFGAFRASLPPREIQVGLRYSF
jgi:hypothetical protein